MPNIDIKSETLNKALDGVKDFLQKLVSPSIEEMGLLFADNVKVWRLKNQIRNLEKVKKIVEKKKMDVKHVNLKVLVPYLEGVSLEEDDALQEMWANLFANYIDKNKNLITHVYPEVLRQLSTDEVKILKFMSSNGGGEVNTEHGIDTDDLSFHAWDLNNLERLGLVRERVELSQYGGDHDPSTGAWRYDLEETGSYYYFVTSFGKDFLEACSAD